MIDKLITLFPIVCNGLGRKCWHIPNTVINMFQTEKTA